MLCAVSFAMDVNLRNVFTAVVKCKVWSTPIMPIMLWCTSRNLRCHACAAPI